ncbi:MAG: hypothetical protein K6F61_02660 [Clostridiales bacterium]|nr:hypothetical protein [Clostridiales bacterium]
MVRNALRKELAAMLKSPAGNRTPVIRRSLREEWIYATDLPALYGGGVPETVRQELDSAGWEYAPDGEWLQMRKAAEEPPEDWYRGIFGTEAACCLSLLQRHAVSEKTPSDAAQRMLIKAGEEGSETYEKACAAIHRKWAEYLRQGSGIPAISRRYFGK